MKIENSSGKIWYGLHFYPGVAEYQDSPTQDPYRVFLNEDTLRQMDPTFAGKPVFVEHVDEVESDINELRKESDGWVIESFFNSADGKHWTKFITVTDRAERAIRNGMRLSNAYIPQIFRQGGLWNGVSYAKEITQGEYEHLAIVKNPRYEESVILTPDEFKQYNENKNLELKKLSNSKGDKMKFNFFKKTKVENFDDEVSVVLPKSGKSITLAKLINDADKENSPVSDGKFDEHARKTFAKNEEEKEADKNSGLADLTHKVKMHDGSYCNVGELMEKHKAMCDELESMKKDGSEKELDMKTTEVEVEGDKLNTDDESMDNDDSDESAKKKALQLAEHEEKEIEEAKKKNAKEKADRLRNAKEVHLAKSNEIKPVTIELTSDKVARGKLLFGSKK